jgi:hypothetical protein
MLLPTPAAAAATATTDAAAAARDDILQGIKDCDKLPMASCCDGHVSQLQFIRLA